MLTFNKMIVANFLLFFILLSVNTNAERRTLYEDDFCKSGDQRWQCKKLSNCPSALNALKKGERPETCTFAGSEPIVCCLNEESNSAPPSPSRPATSKPATPTSNSISKKKCVEYAKYVFSEEVPSILLPLTGKEIEPVKVDSCTRARLELIVAGPEALPKEFPHMAQIGYGDSPNIDWLCGGSLISDRFVLSVAQCSDTIHRGPAKWARLGDLNIGTDTDDARPIILQISERFVHPDYDRKVFYNDIALYKLEKAVTLSTYIRPACLDLGEKPIKQPIAAGWGRTEWGGPANNVLMKAYYNVVDTSKCNSSFAGTAGRKLPEGIVGNSLLCAGNHNGKDTCQQYSGDPLQIALTEPYCMHSVVGLCSFSKGCEPNTPVVYTRVSHFVPWIESIVWP